MTSAPNHAQCEVNGDVEGADKGKGEAPSRGALCGSVIGAYWRC
jgi:hypothetical protein